MNTYDNDGYDEGYRGQNYGDGYSSGHSDSYSYDAYAADSYGADPYPADSYRQEPHPGHEAAGAPPGRASVGNASVGAASVGAAAVGAASVGRASVGRATVGAPPEPPPSRYDWSSGQPGRASAPVSPAVGRASVGRASVRPGAPGGPGGPGGAPPRAAGAGRKPPRKKKRHWIRNSLLSMVALTVMMAGGGMVALSYYVDNVLPPGELELPQGTTFHYSNGKQFAKLADQNREIIDTTELPDHVLKAVVAAEDGTYFEHSGVDFAGIARAAWNNFTGGTTQGASTISQQYARAAADEYDISYARKLREAIMAYKLDKQYEKEQILDFYLNTVYFGRGAYGIEAAAKAYFRKSAAKLDPAEAAVLAAVIKQPEPDQFTGHLGFDPTNNYDEAVARWNYVLDQMVRRAWLPEADRVELEYPEVKENGGCIDDCGVKTPQGNVINYAREELKRELGITDLRTGGYRITTTINEKVQKAARDAARRKTKGSLMEDQPKGLMAALVAIDPKTGRVIAYYGGDDGTGHDYAGKNWDFDQGAWIGGRPPGSSFKIYSLIAAQEAGISFQSRWQTSDYKVPGTDYTVRNAGRNASCKDYCTLEFATVESYNVPFHHISAALGPDRIVEAAKKAGITTMWAPEEGREVAYDLTTTDSVDTPFWHPVSYGQYNVTVLDHASGVATLAARGMYHEPRFVEKVEKRNKNGEWEVIYGDKISGEQRILQSIADSITQVLTKVTQQNSLNGRPAAAKTGTWEVGPNQPGNADAWMVGYTPDIAAAVWVGNLKDQARIQNKWGEDIFGSGLPGQIWKRFMDDAHAALELPPAQFPQAPYVGSDQAPQANGISPTPAPRGGRNRDRDCLLPQLCPPDSEEDEEPEDGGEGGGQPLPGPSPDAVLPQPIPPPPGD